MSDGAFIDTNVFLRHLLDDTPKASAACHDLLKLIEVGAIAAWTTPTVISELVWALGGAVYELGRDAIPLNVGTLCQITGLSLEHRDDLLRACEIFSSLNIDFADAYHAALLEGRSETQLYSYDRDLDKVARLERLEPE